MPPDVISQKKYRIAIVAGELSGDKLGAGLIKAIQAADVAVDFEGVAGPNMQKAGCKALFEAEELAVMGLTEVIKDLPRLLQIKKRLLNHWLQDPPDLFIGIDAPDFNLRLAPVLKARGVHTIQYVCPSVWAWRTGRVKKIELAVNELFCLLPFEPQYFDDTTVAAHYVGHPLADSIPVSERTVSEGSDHLIALLPGSRNSEVTRLLPAFVDTAILLQARYPDAHFLIPAANEKLEQYINTFLSMQSSAIRVTVKQGHVEDVLSQADVALLASGTVALEAMLFGCPMVVAYKLAPSTYRFLKWTNAFKSKYISLPNIIADKPLVQEVLQEGVTAERLTTNISYWLDNKAARQSLMTEFRNLHLSLKQNADQTVAKLLLQALTLNA